MSADVIRVLSLGAGVQSSTLALMMARGVVQPAHHAIFADTDAEPAAVYAWLDWLERQLPFPVHRVMHQDGLTKQIERATTGNRFAGAPFYVESGGRGGMLRRQCTREFKVQPIIAKYRELAGLRRRQRGPRNRVLVEQSIGISLDEIYRVKPSRIAWIRNCWPLIDMRMTRHDCLRWMARNGYPRPPRSACVYCPYRSNEEWRELRDSDPDGWREAIRVDEIIRAGVFTVPNAGALYVHRSMRPLRDADLSTAADHGQIEMFQNECEGLCGV